MTSLKNSKLMNMSKKFKKKFLTKKIEKKKNKKTMKGDETLLCFLICFSGIGTVELCGVALKNIFDQF